MLMNSTKLLLLIMLFLSNMISLSSNNWFGSWLGLEINMMSFIPMMYNKKNYYSSESMMKYFIFQSMGSTIMLLGVVMVNSMLEFNLNLLLVNCGLMMKLGIPPFHMWLPSIMKSMNWMNCMIISTWQKIALLFLLSYTTNKLMIIFIILSLLIGSIGGLNQSSIKKMMAYSSINNMSWIMMSMQASMVLWINYFIIYSLMTINSMLMFKIMKINYLNQCLIENSTINKIQLSMMMFSLGGMPPLLGFLPKLIVIEYMILSNNYMLMLIMVILSLITLFYYTRVMMMMMTINSQKLMWIKLKINKKLLSFISLINISGFIIIMLIKSLI